MLSHWFHRFWAKLSSFNETSAKNPLGLHTEHTRLKPEGDGPGHPESFLIKLSTNLKKLNLNFKKNKEFLQKPRGDCLMPSATSLFRMSQYVITFKKEYFLKGPVIS